MGNRREAGDTVNESKPFWELLDKQALTKGEGPPTPKNRIGFCITWRGEVPGGWLYRVTTTHGNKIAHEHVEFVADPE